ncbi:hypothetical protein MG293_007011 [Ovis ammon polii]|uniref:Transmembrane protease serine n=1 Tax=Ovis ammon polii TaxID=230172 RepID=A0AAD4UFY1_OVIAM|nr:hypothetical protein MG293_007011 [Ovis ammon polii]
MMIYSRSTGTHRAAVFDSRSRGLKPWMIALLIVLLLTVVAVAIGLLVHFLVSDQKMEYYHATFKISDLRGNRNSGQNSPYQFMELREISENLVDETFIDSAFNKHYIKNQVVKLTPEENGTTVDVIMVFQFPSAESSAVRNRKIRSVLDEKIRNTRALSINTSSVEVNGCGKRVVPLVSNRIMSGEIAGKAAWPWQASLQHKNIHQCGATLISNTWLVTAAHCFKNKANPRQWTVSFGTKINPPLMKRNIKRITVHERYRSPAREYDIAVVQFSPRVTFTDDIRRICLPEASASFQPNSTVYITGFGALFYGGESQNDLREARLKIISDDMCKQPHVYGSDIKFGMMCAGYLEGIYDACRGDSGGPLVGKDLKDTWYLIGIEKNINIGDGKERTRIVGGKCCQQKPEDNILHILKKNQKSSFYQSSIQILNVQYSDELSSPATEKYRTLSGNIESMITRTFKESDLKNQFVKAHVVKLSINWPGYSTIVHSSYSDPRQWIATFGTSTTSPQQRVAVRSILIHDNYNPETHENDIALVQLDKEVTFNRYIHTVCLPEANQAISPGSTAYVTGWGSQSYSGSTVTNLQQARVNIISNYLCNAPAGYNGAVLPGMLCAGVPEGGVDACQGDSGGPLVQEDSRQHWFIVGIVSWGYQCGLPDKPGVYTRVTAYRHWITQKTGI